MTAKDLNRKTNAKSRPGLSFTLIRQIWFREFLITPNKVVAINKRKRNPKIITYQLSPKPRIFLTTCLTCSAPSFPRVFEMFSISPRPILPGPMRKPNNCASINTMGANANVVKNAVAPAILSGSFFPNKPSESRRLLIKSDISFPFDLVAGMNPIKIKK